MPLFCFCTVYYIFLLPDHPDQKKVARNPLKSDWFMLSDQHGLANQNIDGYSVNQIMFREIALTEVLCGDIVAVIVDLPACQ